MATAYLRELEQREAVYAVGCGEYDVEDEDEDDIRALAALARAIRADERQRAALAQMDEFQEQYNLEVAGCIAERHEELSWQQSVAAPIVQRLQQVSERFCYSEAEMLELADYDEDPEDELLEAQMYLRRSLLAEILQSVAPYDP